jgi:flagellar secretion chaperone FliS
MNQATMIDPNTPNESMAEIAPPGASDGASAYFKTKVMTANPVELRLMLLEGAVRFAQQIRTALENKEHEGVYVGATRCQAILLELLNGLRPEHDKALCDRLSALYTFMYTTLVKATVDRNAALAGDVIGLLQHERDTWRMLVDQLSAENRTAGALTATPDVRPASGGGVRNAGNLVGAMVSVKG